jgi:hypothetical protein
MALKMLAGPKYGSFTRLLKERDPLDYLNPRVLLRGDPGLNNLRPKGAEKASGATHFKSFRRRRLIVRRWNKDFPATGLLHKVQLPFRLRHIQVRIGCGGSDTSPGSALDKSDLDEIGLNHVFNGVRVFADGHGDIV